MNNLHTLATQVLELGKIMLTLKEKIEQLENRIQQLEQRAKP